MAGTEVFVFGKAPMVAPLYIFYSISAARPIMAHIVRARPRAV